MRRCPPLAEAQRRFQALADAGDADAARMAGVSITEQGDCLRDLGRLEAAAAAYEEAIQRGKQRDDDRSVAVGSGQLGTVRLLQGRYAEALAAYEDARAIFERLGEPGTVATAWHQIGMVHRQVQQFEAAERAYRQALGIRVQHKLRTDEAASLLELGNLYDDWGRPEEAVAFYRQAADLYTALGDQASEGRAHSNIAETLRRLGRTGEARREIVRAIECLRPFGHAAEPWKPFVILHDIEQASGNGPAAAAAWRQARDAYLAYRREGGYAQSGIGKLCDAIWQAVQQGGVEAGAAVLQQVTATSQVTATLERLQAILAGARDPALADDPDLPYGASAELLLLLERLGG